MGVIILLVGIVASAVAYRCLLRWLDAPPDVPDADGPTYDGRVDE